MDISALVIDFSRVLIFANVDTESLNRHHAALKPQPGYRVLEHFRLNTELLNYLRDLSQRVPIYLFSDGNLHTLPEIAPALQGIFRATYRPEEFGYTKRQPEAYLALAYKLNYPPTSILFIDDSPANIAAAASAGLTTYRYETNAAVMAFLDRASKSRNMINFPQ